MLVACRALAFIAPALLVLLPRAAYAVDRIPFTVANGLVEVQGAVDGSSPVPMLVNLGAGVDVLSTDLGRRFVVIQGKYVSLRLTGERVDLPIGIVQSLAIGGVRIEAPHVGIWSGLDGTANGGLISATAFRNVTTTFDFRNDEIVIEDAQTFPDRTRQTARVPIVLQDDLGIALGLFVRFDFGAGRTGLCEIDTGSSSITLDRAFASSIGLTPDAQGHVAVATLALAGAAQTAIVDPTVGVGNLIYDCDVGNAFWTGRAFTLDLPNHFMYVSTAS